MATLSPSSARTSNEHAASLSAPLNLLGWIGENRHLLKPPAANKCIWEDRDFIVVVNGGPSQRKDYHINPTEELFFQIEGDIVLKIVDAMGVQREIPIRAGEMFLLPPKVPHSPQRAAGTVGVVIERRRPRGEDDQMRFYCERCNEVVYEQQFELADVAVQLKKMMDEFWSDATLRTCFHCGLVVNPPSGVVQQPHKDARFPAELKVGAARKPAASKRPAPVTPSPVSARVVLPGNRKPLAKQIPAKGR